MSDFSTIDNSSQPVTSSTSSSSTDSNALDLTIPGSVLTGTSAGIQQLGGPSMFADNNNKHIVVAPNGTPQVVMGNQDTFGEGFYVAKTGVNALTNTDPTQWIFNSNQDTFKILSSGTEIITVPSGYSAGDAYQVTVSHNLGYAPIPFGFVTPNSSVATKGTVWPLPYSQVDYNFSLGGFQIDAYANLVCDQNNLYIQLTVDANNAYNGTWTFKYYLLQESAVPS